MPALHVLLRKLQKGDAAPSTLHCVSCLLFFLPSLAITPKPLSIQARVGDEAGEEKEEEQGRTERRREGEGGGEGEGKRKEGGQEEGTTGTMVAGHMVPGEGPGLLGAMGEVWA